MTKAVPTVAAATADAPVALMKEAQAAHYLGTTANQLRLSRHSGELWVGVPAPRFVRVGRGVRYLKNDLDAWIAALPTFSSNADARSRGVSVRTVPLRYSGAVGNKPAR